MRSLLVRCCVSRNSCSTSLETEKGHVRMSSSRIKYPLCSLSPGDNMLEVTSIFLACFSPLLPKTMRKGKREAVLLLFCLMKTSLLHAISVVQTCFLSSWEAASLIASVCSKYLDFIHFAGYNKGSLACLFSWFFLGRKMPSYFSSFPWRYGRVSTINLPECWRNEEDHVG